MKSLRARRSSPWFWTGYRSVAIVDLWINGLRGIAMLFCDIGMPICFGCSGVGPLPPVEVGGLLGRCRGLFFVVEACLAMLCSGHVTGTRARRFGRRTSPKTQGEGQGNEELAFHKSPPHPAVQSPRRTRPTRSELELRNPCGRIAIVTHSLRRTAVCLDRVIGRGQCRASSIAQSMRGVQCPPAKTARIPAAGCSHSGNGA